MLPIIINGKFGFGNCNCRLGMLLYLLYIPKDFIIIIIIIITNVALNHIISPHSPLVKFDVQVTVPHDKLL